MGTPTSNDFSPLMSIDWRDFEVGAASLPIHSLAQVGGVSLGGGHRDLRLGVGCNTQLEPKDDHGDADVRNKRADSCYCLFLVHTLSVHRESRRRQRRAERPRGGALHGCFRARTGSFEQVARRLQ